MKQPRIDLEFAKQRIHGFAEMMRIAQETKKSEQEYRDRYLNSEAKKQDC